MPEKTYYKPNRSHPRYFKMCDAARIAREVVRDNPGDTPEEVLACIAKGLGFTHISLSRTRVMEAGIGGLPAVIRNLPAVIDAIITTLMALVKKYAWLWPILKNAIDLFKEVKDAIDRWEKFTEPKQAKVEDVISEGKCKCKKETTSTPKLIGQSK